MAVSLYWRERLLARNPIKYDAFRQEGFDVKYHDGRPGDTWPLRVAKQALLSDYLKWFEEEYLKTFRGVGYYQDFPDALPKPATELEFFTSMSAFLYLTGRHNQTRGYFVWGVTGFEDRFVRARVHRNFIRLCEHNEHVAQYELVTGDLLTQIPELDRVQRVADAQRRAAILTRDNTARLPKGMKKPRNGLTRPD